MFYWNNIIKKWKKHSFILYMSYSMYNHFCPIKFNLIIVKQVAKHDCKIPIFLICNLASNKNEHIV